MIRWYVSYFALTYDDKNTFDYVIATTLTKDFPIKSIVEEIEFANNHKKVTLINWKMLNDIEYLHHEGQLGGVSR